jgi:sporulation protein YlmC with PRC-barrel domain
MKQRFPLRQAALASAVAAALALPAFADTGRTGASAAPAAFAHGSGIERTQPHQQTRIESPHAQAQARDDLRISQAIGMEVRGRDGQKLGTLRDLVVDLNENRVHYGVLEPEGSDRLFALPARAFQTADGRQHLALNALRQDFESSLGFPASDRWPGMADAEYWNRIHRQFGMEMALEPSRQQALRRASELIRTDVTDRTGAYVGEIRDVVVNLNDGTVHYTVVGFSDQRMADGLVALPLAVLEPAYGRDALLLNLSREQIAQAPSFSEERWPDPADSGFRDSLNRILVIVVQQPATAQAHQQSEAGVVGMQQPPGESDATRTDQAMTGVQGRSPLQDPGVLRDQGGRQQDLSQLQQQATERLEREQQPVGTRLAPDPAGPGTGTMQQAPTPDTAAPQIDERPFTEESFKRLDRDGDGRISAEEARMDPTFMAAWNELDRDKSGFVTWEDVSSYRDRKGLR